MKYPYAEDLMSKKKSKKELREKEIRLYKESDSFEEFEIKRSLEGIEHRFVLNDNFKIYYFINNSWLRKIFIPGADEYNCLIPFVLIISFIFFPMIIFKSFLLLGFMIFASLCTIFAAIIQHKFNLVKHLLEWH